ncbi:MAG: XDD3 family exosortase-dependent surface protein [Elainella sp.]
MKFATQLGTSLQTLLRTAALSAAAVGTVTVGTVTVGILASAQQAQAGTFHNGWNYSIDSFNDGTEGRIIGENSKFEFYGMASKQTKDKVYFAFTSNLSLNGYDDAGALNKKISYGDLFLNFTNPTSFNQADGKLYGVRFDNTNDTRFTSQRTVTSGRRTRTITETKAPELGLYQNVTTTSYTTRNRGYSSPDHHTKTVASYKGQASYGDLAANTSYFDNSKAALTNMASGSFLGGIQAIADFKGLGLDFANFNTKGTYTFGFSIDKALLPNGKFVANLFAECGNDGMVLTGELTDVPEPSVMAGLAVVGLTVAASRVKKVAKQQAAS